MNENPYESPKTACDHEAPKSGINWLGAIALALLVVALIVVVFYLVLGVALGIAYEMGLLGGIAN